MNDQLKLTIRSFVDDIGTVSQERRDILDPAARYIASRLEADLPVSLTFICTHNSRRSHLAQAWCQVAAYHYGLPGVRAYSGGIETTACNPRTIRALERAGLGITRSTGGENPHYLAHPDPRYPPIELYSKIYDTAENPQSGYAAMMCCSDVDEKCPLVRGADLRVPLHYRDPKESDDTPEEAGTYDRRCREIGIEMFYMLSRV